MFPFAGEGGYPHARTLSVSDGLISRYVVQGVPTPNGECNLMRRLLVSALAVVAVAAPLSLIGAPSANAVPPCREGYVLSGLVCVPDPNAPQAVPVVPVVPAPQQSPGVLGQVLGVVDRPTGRNLEPVAVVPAAPAPAPPPGSPNQSGGNAAGSPGVLGPVGVGPVIPQGTCSPMVNIIVLGSASTCPPGPVVIAQPAPAPAPPAVVVVPARQPPTAAQALIPQYSLPVTH